MFKKLSMSACCFALCALGYGAYGADVVDRIVATVNRHIILQSDWEDEIHYEAFANGRPLSALTTADLKAALDRLIDQELLREQIRNGNLEHASAEDVEKRILEIREQHPKSQTEEEWRSLLERYALTEPGLETRVQTELDLMRLVDARLRPTVNVDSKSIESYYNQELLPQLRQSSRREVSLIEVTPTIKELLTQLRVSQLLTQWLQSLRAGSEIHNEAFESGTGGQTQ